MQAHEQIWQDNKIHMLGSSVIVDKVQSKSNAWEVRACPWCKVYMKHSRFLLTPSLFNSIPHRGLVLVIVTSPSFTSTDVSSSSHFPDGSHGSIWQSTPLSYQAITPHVPKALSSSSLPLPPSPRRMCRRHHISQTEATAAFRQSTPLSCQTIMPQTIHHVSSKAIAHNNRS